LADIRDHFDTIPSGSTLILDGICPYSGPAPVFLSVWDLSSALSLLYRHEGIAANVVTRSLNVGQKGLLFATPDGWATYPFGQMDGNPLGRKKGYRWADGDAGRRFSETGGADRINGCPPDGDGNGVDVLNGAVPMLGGVVGGAGPAPPP